MKIVSIKPGSHGPYEFVFPPITSHATAVPPMQHSFSADHVVPELSLEDLPIGNVKLSFTIFAVV